MEMTRTERKRSQKQDQILNAADELIAAEGIEALTMQKLAGRLDYAVGALYRYFASKELLLAHLQVRALEHYLALYRRIGQTWTDPLLCLALCADIFALSAESWPAEFALVSEATAIRHNLLTPDQGLPVLLAAKQVLACFESWLNAASERGELSTGDRTTRALLFWTSIQGLLLTRKLAVHAPGLFGPALLDDLVVTLFRGWGAGPDKIEKIKKEWQLIRGSSDLMSLLQELRKVR